MSNVSSFVRGLLLAGACAGVAAGCVDEKEELAKGVVDDSSPPGTPSSLVAGKADGATTFTVALESAHPYANNLDRRYDLALDSVVPSCASRVRVHFAALRTEARYDFVHVLNADGSIAESLDGRRDNTWSAWIEVGSPKVLSLVLDTDGSITDYGFRVDAVEAELAVKCTPVPTRPCDEGYFDVTEAPDTCECAGPIACAEDAWVEIEHTVGGGFTGAVQGRRTTGTTAQNVTYSPESGEDTAIVGAIDRAAMQELVTAIVNSGILDRAEVEEPSNWSETLRIRIGTRAVAFTRPQGSFPADEQALIARFEALFSCTEGALACGDGLSCSDDGACVAESSCVCPAHYDPVCGADGRTYSNACAIGCAGVTMKHAGECGTEGDLCGGLGGFPCQDAFKCRYDASVYEAPHPDAAGTCVAADYCDAVADCAGLPHIAVPGTWACEANQCEWKTGPAWQPVTGFSFTTTHPYGNNANVWKQLYLPAGGAKMRLVASGTFNLEQGYDKLEVWEWRNGTWVKTKTYTGTAAPAATDEFVGTYFYLHFVSDSSVTKHGFEITAEYAN